APAITRSTEAVISPSLLGAASPPLLQAINTRPIAQTLAPRPIMIISPFRSSVADQVVAAGRAGARAGAITGPPGADLVQGAGEVGELGHALAGHQGIRRDPRGVRTRLHPVLQLDRGDLAFGGGHHPIQ